MGMFGIAGSHDGKHWDENTQDWEPDNHCCGGGGYTQPPAPVSPSNQDLYKVLAGIDNKLERMLALLEEALRHE